MANIGFSELIVILFILMLVFGASRLPALGESLGKAIRTFKRGLAQNEQIEVSQVDKVSQQEHKRVSSGGNTHDAAISDAEIVDDKQH